jgi:hypothetical protein
VCELPQAIDAADAAEAHPAAAVAGAGAAAAMEAGLLARMQQLQRVERQRLERTHSERDATLSDEGEGAATECAPAASPLATPTRQPASWTVAAAEQRASPSGERPSAGVGDDESRQRRRRSSGFAGACDALLRHRVITRHDGSVRSPTVSPSHRLSLLLPPTVSPSHRLSPTVSHCVSLSPSLSPTASHLCLTPPSPTVMAQVRSAAAADGGPVQVCGAPPPSLH